MRSLRPEDYRDIVTRALAEDVGTGDVTTLATVAAAQQARGILLAKSECVVAGLDAALDAFRQLQPSITVTLRKQDGDRVVPGETIGEVRGLARTRPVEADGAPVGTILALFDPSAEPPAELTQFDRAYLGAIYRGLPNLTGIKKVHGVNREMRRQAAAERTVAVEGRAGDGEARSPE